MSAEQQADRPLDVVRALGALIPAYQQWTSAHIPTDGLSPARMRILSFLRETGGVPMRALRERYGSSATNITGLVDGLEADGLVTREDDPADRRVTRVVLTEEGERRSRSDWERYETSCAATFEALDPDERERLVRALRDLRQLLMSRP